MPLITWSKQYSVNIKQIDDQHQQLIHLLNTLHDSMKAGKGKEAIKEVLDSLVSYTKSHFALEEKLFRDHGYPAAAVHKAEHDKLTAQVAKVQKDFQSGKVVLTIDVLQFLRDWLNNHIQLTDKQYTAFLNGKGVV